MYKSHLHLHIQYTYMLLQWHVNAHYYIKVAISWICTHIYNGIWAYINRKDYWSRVGATVGVEAELNLILQLKSLCSRNWVLSQSKVLVSGKTSTLAKYFFYILIFFNLILYSVLTRLHCNHLNWDLVSLFVNWVEIEYTQKIIPKKSWMKKLNTGMQLGKRFSNNSGGGGRIG